MFTFQIFITRSFWDPSYQKALCSGCIGSAYHWKWLIWYQIISLAYVSEHSVRNRIVENFEKKNIASSSKLVIKIVFKKSEIVFAHVSDHFSHSSWDEKIFLGHLNHWKHIFSIVSRQFAIAIFWVMVDLVLKILRKFTNFECKINHISKTNNRKNNYPFGPCPK